MRQIKPVYSSHKLSARRFGNARHGKHSSHSNYLSTAGVEMPAGGELTDSQTSHPSISCAPCPWAMHIASLLGAHPAYMSM
jgi:hypothetical protein